MFVIPNDNRIQGKVQDEAQRVCNEEVPLAVETQVEPIDLNPKIHVRQGRGIPAI